MSTATKESTGTVELEKPTKKARMELLHDKTFLTGAVIVIGVALVGLIAPFISPYPSHGEGSVSADILKPPGGKYLLGTSENGRDVLTRVLYGARTSLIIAVSVVAISVSIGTLIGVVAGYLGGLIDELLMRITDVFMAFPHLLLSLLIVATLGPGLNTVIIALGVSWWPWHARLSRSQTISIRNRPFVMATKALGVRASNVMARHILPNAIPPTIVQLTSDLGRAILSAAGLSFLGLGVTEPLADWGLDISKSRDFFPLQWWYATFPGIALFATVLGFILMGDALRDYIEPIVRTKSRLGGLVASK